MNLVETLIFAAMIAVFTATIIYIFRKDASDQRLRQSPEQ
jgi:hypothetical protein